MDLGVIIFIVLITLVLIGGLLWYFFGQPRIDCTKKEADTTKHIKTWIKDDKTSNCNIDTCEDKYEKSSDGTTCTIKAKKPTSSKYKLYSDYPCHDSTVQENTPCPTTTYETAKTQEDCEKLCDDYKKRPECLAISWDDTNKKCSLYKDSNFYDKKCTGRIEACYKKTS